MPQEVLKQENEVVVDKASKFKIIGSSFEHNYEFTINCPAEGCTIEQTTEAFSNAIKEIYEIWYTHYIEC